jgi:hypothetical protein
MLLPNPHSSKVLLTLGGMTPLNSSQMKVGSFEALTFIVPKAQIEGRLEELTMPPSVALSLEIAPV